MEQFIDCKSCESKKVERFINFGEMPPGNFYPTSEEISNPDFKEPTFNMAVGFCHDCSMVQLLETVDYETSTKKDDKGNWEYAYHSSSSTPMKKHFASFANEVMKKLPQYGKILEIGSNDGIFLQNFLGKYNVLGIEPFHNVAEIARQKGIPVVTEFFTYEFAKDLTKSFGNFEVVAASNTAINIPNQNSFISGIETLLTDKGFAVIENPDLSSMLKKDAFDQIYDEHIFYYSLNSLEKLFNRHGMEIFDCAPQEVHGGSMRVYAGKIGKHQKTKVLEYKMENEEKNRLNSVRPYKEFSRRVEKNKARLQELVGVLTDDSRGHERKIIGYGATSKANMIYNFCNLNNETIEYITDTTPYKQGSFTPLTHIPIVSPEYFQKDYSENTRIAAFLGAWNYASPIINKEKDFINTGGLFFTHIPSPQIINPLKIEV